MAKITTNVDIDLEDLAFKLYMELDQEQLAEFIKTLDAYYSGWDFTSMLFEYFKSEMQKEKEANS